MEDLTPPAVASEGCRHRRAATAGRQEEKATQIIGYGAIAVWNERLLFNAIRAIDDKRFFQLQKLAGAYQGEHNEPNKNQLFDAYHLWCAESANADFFLTHDEKLVRQWKNSKYKGFSEPIDAMPLVRRLLKRNIWLFIPMIKEAIKIRRSRRNLGLKYQEYSDVDEKFR